MGNAPSSPQTAEPVLTDEQNLRRQNIANEILQTEQSYVMHLAFVSECYIMPLMQALRTNKPIISEIEIKKVFSDWNAISEFHYKMLKPEIQARVEKWSPTQILGDIFVKHSEMMKIYTVYVNNYDGVYDKVEQLSKKKEFKQFLTDARTSPRHTQLNLLGYLIMPIQRIPRYVLLLADLLKHTPPYHPDYKNLQDAVAKIQGVAKYINEKKREDENSKKLFAIAKSIDGTFDEPLVQSQRYLVREGPVELVKVLLKKATPKDQKKFTIFSKKDKKLRKEGFLMKEGGSFKTWKKRWFVLDGTTVSYYAEEITSKDTLPELKGTFELTESKVLSDEEKRYAGKSPEHIVIEIKPGERLFTMEESNPVKRLEWSKAFTDAVEFARKQKSPTEDSKPKDNPNDYEDGSKALGLPSGKYYLFLFNDLILLCDKGMRNYKLKGSMAITYQHQISSPNENTFIYETNDAIFHFKDTPQNITAWVSDIQKLIDSMIEDRKNSDAFEAQSNTSFWQSMSNFFQK